MSLVNRESNLILTWSADCVISCVTEATKFELTHKTLCSSCNFNNSR